MNVDASTDQIPARQEGQDEGLILIALRRNDPGNPDGSATPDIGDALSVPDEDFINALVAYCIDKGFDPSVSYVAVVGVIDVEEGAGATLSDVQQMLG